MTERIFRRTQRRQPWQKMARDIAKLFQHPGFLARVQGNPVPRLAAWLTRTVSPRRLRNWLLSFYMAPTIQAGGKPLPEKPLSIPDKWWFCWQQAETRVRIDKARSRLGYAPQFDLARGMERTHNWAHWANLPGVTAPAK
jgi:hypothetical protein